MEEEQQPERPRRRGREEPSSSSSRRAAWARQCPPRLASPRLRARRPRRQSRRAAAEDAASARWSGSLASISSSSGCLVVASEESCLGIAGSTAGFVGLSKNQLSTADNPRCPCEKTPDRSKHDHPLEEQKPAFNVFRQPQMPLRVTNHAPISTISRSVTSHFLHDNHLSLLASPRHTDTHHARADAPCARQIVSPPAHQITRTPKSSRQKETPTNTTPYKEVPAFIIPAHCM